MLILLFTFLSRLSSQLVSQRPHRISHNYSLVNLTSTVVRLPIVALGFFIALGISGFDITVTALLAGTGVIALAVAFIFQDLTLNFISGITSYIDDLGKDQQFEQTTITQLSVAIDGRPVELYCRHFGDDNVQFVHWFWTNPIATRVRQWR
jgi:small-conductance mechanosensitive channel